VSEAAVLCPSFYKADIVFNPGKIERVIAAFRSAVIGSLQRFIERRRVTFAM
jgi:indolepyruvate ferredoxin oxidoreductase alpha subunit